MTAFRLALRQLFMRPALSVTVVVVLALGIGATTGMYSIYHTVLVQRLPVPEPERLVNFGSPGPKWGPVSAGRAGPPQYVFSYPMVRELAAGQQAFAGIAGHRSFDANIEAAGRTLAGSGMLVTGDYFNVLRLRPALGRLIGAQDEPALGESAVAVLSYDYWRDEFGADPGVVDRDIVVNGQLLRIVGVAPEGFSGTTLGYRPAVFVPLTLFRQMLPLLPVESTDRRAYWVYAFARLQDGIEAEQAEASINGLYAGILTEIEAPLNAEIPQDAMTRFLARRILLEDGSRGQSTIPRVGRQPLKLLLGVAAVVMLVVCVNVASLLLVQGEARMGETAVRASLGASRLRLAVQFLAEAAVLAVLGGFASVPVAAATIQLVVSLVPVNEAGSIVFALDRAAFAFASGITLATLLVFGLLPALRTARVEPMVLLSAYAQRSIGHRLVERFRTLLATGQIALATLLLALAGLFAQSLYNITRVELGMEVGSLVSFSVSPALNGYDGARSASLFERIEEALAARSGITAVAASMVPLLTGTNWTSSPVSVEGFESGADANRQVSVNHVSPSFFRTMSIPILLGRGFTRFDDAEAPRVAVANEAFLEKFGLLREPLGKRLSWMRGDDEIAIEIVGIVPDTKYSEVKDRIPPQVFLPIEQNSGSVSLTYYVRGSLGAERTMQDVLAIVASVDPSLPVNDLMTVTDVVSNNVFLDRLVGLLTSGLAALATLLAAIGLYGTLAYGVSRRTREFGVRLALGATPAGLRRDVLARVGAMTLAGAIIGLVAAMLIGRIAEALLFEVSSLSPLVLGTASVFIGAVALLASSIPARRAARISPIEALRYE